MNFNQVLRYLSVVLLSSTVIANTINVPADYTTIQAAINAAVNGDTIIVQPETYYENINFNGKNIILTSTDPNDSAIVENTVIDGNGGDTVVRFAGTETSSCVLQGFKITNGLGNVGGIEGWGTHATIRSCLIYANTGYMAFGGLWDCDGVIAGCTISENVGSNEGGGLSYCDGAISNSIVSNNYSGSGMGAGFSNCNASITDCIITGNEALEGAGLYACDGSITHCTISNNLANYGNGGGVYDCDGLINNCLIVANVASALQPDYYDGGGGLYLCDGEINNCTIIMNESGEHGGGLYKCNGSIRNCIIWGNQASAYGDQIYTSSTPTYSCIQDWTGSGTGNINSDPLFITGPGGDYYLGQTAAGQAITSPCVDAGSDTAANLCLNTLTTRIDEIGDGSIVDMGFHYQYSLIYPIGDLNLDTKVDFFDFNILAGQWQGSPTNPSADIAPYPDGDNYVDFDDLLLLIEHWLEGTY